MTKILAEVGINHNGDIEIAKKLIDGAAQAGCDAVKFQKRAIDTVYTQEYLAEPRESPWGTTQRDQKQGLEFGKAEFDQIDAYCKEKNIDWFASSWDTDSQKFLQQYSLKYNKIASAMLTHKPLLDMVAEEGRHTYISTGMSTMEEIEQAVQIFRDKNCPFELMHCTSTYPMDPKDANLRVIPKLKEKFNCDVGYSGHEVGLVISAAAVTLGATSVERHITLDRAMYGSDQAASIEIDGFNRLVRYIRAVELALGDGEKKILPAEEENKKKLRYFT